MYECIEPSLCTCPIPTISNSTSQVFFSFNYINYLANDVLACVLHIHVPFGKINVHVYHHSVYTGLLM